MFFSTKCLSSPNKTIAMKNYMSYLNVSVASMLLFLMSFTTLNAQSGITVDYFNHQLDSLVASLNDAEPVDNEERTNPVYYRMFTPTVLYRSAVSRAIKDGFDLPQENADDEIALNDNREIVIDKLLVDVYKNNPEYVTKTESQLRGETTEVLNKDYKTSAIKVNTDAPLKISDSSISSLETEYRKPNYWRTRGDVSLNFSQNYVSDNWHAGGDNNYTLLTMMKFQVNYDDKKRLTFNNTFEARLGFTTSSSDVLHKIRTNDDMLRIESNLGYKIIKNLDVSCNFKMQTQSMPSYPVNNPDFVSNFMAPFDASLSVGLKYACSGKNWNIDLFVAPFSSNNYRFVRFGHLAERFGMGYDVRIDESGNEVKVWKKHRYDYGTQLVFKPSVTIAKNITWDARMEFYTNYGRTFFEWENHFKFKINRYIETNLLLHTRFDDNAPGLYDDKLGFWQLKEYFTLGVSYSWP